MRKTWIVLASLCLLIAAAARADGPPDPVGSFGTAKRIARDTIYADHKETFYCGCGFRNNSTSSGGTINTQSNLSGQECGYRLRKSTNHKRGRRLEWEHIAPAAAYAGNFSCWRNGHDECGVDSNGRPIKGRKCCKKVDNEEGHAFEIFEADLHNLVPSVGEVNGDRSSHPHGNIDDVAEWTYGACPFEIGPRPRQAEALALSRDAGDSREHDVRGDTARIWFYMIDAYDIDVEDAFWDEMVDWSDADPVDDWEMERDRRIFDAQGNHNPYVLDDTPN